MLALVSRQRDRFVAGIERWSKEPMHERDYTVPGSWFQVQGSGSNGPGTWNFEAGTI
jgi:hypothetical protein